MTVPSGTSVDIEAVAAALDAGLPADEVLDLVDGALERASEAGDGASLGRLAGLLDDAAAGRPDARGLAIAAARARTAAAAAGSERPTTPERSDSAPSSEPAHPPVAAALSVRYSGWWRRALAIALDWLVLLTAIGFAAPESDGGAVLALVVLPYAYFALLHALSRGQTLGKAVFGIAVRRDDGGLIGLSSALVRSIVQGLLWITVIGGVVDSLVPLGDARRRSLHDRAASTVVVRVR